MRLEPERLHALLIGIDEYGAEKSVEPGSGYPPLAGCVGDAARMERYLVGDLAVPQSQVETLLAPRLPETRPGPSATYERIVGAFAGLATRARPGDRVWIHYSGHGGRSPTSFPELKGPRAFDEALVPSDIAQPGSRYLRDVDLAYLLDRLVRGGLFVTLVLDCCHAGGLLREELPKLPGAQARWNDVTTWDRPRESAVAGREELARCWRRLAAALPRRSAEGLLQVAGYTALLACRPFERAYEYEVEPGRKSGALTHFLLESLRAVGPEATYQACFERLRGQMRGSLGSFQNPVLDGEVDRRLLSAGSEAPSRGVTVLLRDAGRVLLGAGAVQGIEAGALFEIEPLLAASAAPRAIVEVEAVSGAECWARPSPDTLQGAPEPEPGDRALLWSLAPRRATVAFHLGAATGSELGPGRRLCEELASLESRMLRWSDRADADLHLRVALDGAWSLSDRSGSPLQPPLPQEVRGKPDSRHLLAVLEHVAQYRALETLSNDDPTCPLRQAIAGRLTRLRPDGSVEDDPGDQPERSGGTVEVEAGAWVALLLENRFDQPLDVTVLDLSPAWSIEQIHPATGDSRSLDPGERVQVPFRVAPVPGLATSRDRLKVFVTYDPVRFRWLELPALGERQRRISHDERPRHPLESQLSAWRSAIPLPAVELRDRFTSREWMVFDLMLEVRAPSISPRPP